MILERKKAENRLVVDEAVNDDNSVVSLHPTTMEKLQIFRGDAILIKDGKEKQAAPSVQLNVICLLADLNVSVNKPEIIDMILPLFIESLEEGDASTAGLLRLRVSRSPTVKLWL